MGWISLVEHNNGTLLIQTQRQTQQTTSTASGNMQLHHQTDLTLLSKLNSELNLRSIASPAITPLQADRHITLPTVNAMYWEKLSTLLLFLLCCLLLA